MHNHYWVHFSASQEMQQSLGNLTLGTKRLLPAPVREGAHTSNSFHLQNWGATPLLPRFHQVRGELTPCGMKQMPRPQYLLSSQIEQPPVPRGTGLVVALLSRGCFRLDTLQIVRQTHYSLLGQFRRLSMDRGKQRLPYWHVRRDLVGLCRSVPQNQRYFALWKCPMVFLA